MNDGGREIFRTKKLGDVEFKNRLIRSSIGGRTAYYNGRVNEAWGQAESRFAAGGVGGLISATLTVDDDRWSPIEYPKLTRDEFVAPIQRGIDRVRQAAEDCRYIIQLGDPGYHTQASLVSEPADEVSSSGGFDLIYGYRNRRRALRRFEIGRIVDNFAKAARLAVETGCDGIEVTASKGYVIHQFLNPAINRRKDCYGGSLENRFRLLKEIMLAIRDVVGPKFLLGVRLSANDYNSYPPLAAFFRWPWLWFLGNGLHETLQIGRWLRDLTSESGEPRGIDYLHISNGYGFINPKENPGDFPVDMVRRFCRSTSHLSAKAWIRAVGVGVFPGFLQRLGWRRHDGVNLPDAVRFKREVGLPVIANGGFQERSLIEHALADVDFVSMARPLLANPDLPKLFQNTGAERPINPCTFCNRCAVATTIYPLGCYDRSRFGSDKEMERAILELNSPG